MYELSKAIRDDRLREADQRRRARIARDRRRRGSSADRRVALDRLRPLLAEAGALSPADDPGWARLRAAAAATTARLAADGVIPGHLVVSADDGPALVNRTLAAAWRRTARGRR